MGGSMQLQQETVEELGSREHAVQVSTRRTDVEGDDGS